MTDEDADAIAGRARVVFSNHLPPSTMLLASIEDLQAAFQAVYYGEPIPAEVMKRIGIIVTQD